VANPGPTRAKPIWQEGRGGGRGRAAAPTHSEALSREGSGVAPPLCKVVPSFRQVFGLGGNRLRKEGIPTAAASRPFGQCLRPRIDWGRLQLSFLYTAARQSRIRTGFPLANSGVRPNRHRKARHPTVHARRRQEKCALRESPLASFFVGT